MENIALEKSALTVDATSVGSSDYDREQGRKIKTTASICPH